MAAVVRSIDGARVTHALVAADLSLLLLATLCTVLLNALRPLRWLWLLQSEAPRATYLDALKSHLFSTGARLVVPGQVGELAKALAVDIEPAKAAGLAGVDVGLDVSTTLLVAAVGGALIFGPGPALIGLIGSGGLLLMWRKIGRRLTDDPQARWQIRLAAAWRAGGSVSRFVLFKGFVLSLGLQGLRLLQLVLLIGALGAVPSLAAVAALPAVQVADAFSFTVGRIGVREWLGSAMLPGFGLGADVGVTAIFLQTLISNILPGLVGVVVVYGARRTALARLRLLGAP